MKGLMCKLLGHRSICIFMSQFRWEHAQWAETTTVYRCERCGHDEMTTYQSPI